MHRIRPYPVAAMLSAILYAQAAKSDPAVVVAGTNVARVAAWIAEPATNPAPGRVVRPGAIVEKQIVLVNSLSEPRRFTYRWEAFLGRRAWTGEEDTGEIDSATTLLFPIEFTVPTNVLVTGRQKPDRRGKLDGRIDVIAVIGERLCTNSFDFRVREPARPGGEIALFDPAGRMENVLSNIGYRVIAWDPHASTGTVVIGRDALSGTADGPVNLGLFVQGGGRAVVMAQGSDWLRDRLGFQVTDAPSPGLVVAFSSHPVVRGLDTLDLADWTASCSLLKPHAESAGSSQSHGLPGYARPLESGAKSASHPAPREPPDRGWQAILVSPFDRNEAAILELNYGRGRLLLCSPAVETHALANPAAELLLHRLIEYARSPR